MTLSTSAEIKKSTNIRGAFIIFILIYSVGFKFLYHRLDLVRPDNPCVHFPRYASKGNKSGLIR